MRRAYLSLGSNIEPFIKQSLGLRSPNGTLGTFHNGLVEPVAINQYTSLISHPDLKAAAIWNVTPDGSGW